MAESVIIKDPEILGGCLRFVARVFPSKIFSITLLQAKLLTAF